MKIELAPVMLAGFLALAPDAPIQAQATQQVLLSGIDAGNAYTQDIAAVPDGSRYVQLDTDSGQVFMRLDPNGAMEWCQRLSTTQVFMMNHFPMTTMPDGGLSVLLPKLPLWVGEEQHFEVVRLAPDGTLLWSKLIIAPDSGAIIGSIAYSMCSNASGDLFCTIKISLGSVVAKLDGTGTLQWCRRIWDLDVAAALEMVEAVEPTSDGGCVFLGVRNFAGFENAISVGRLDMFGDLLWIRSYTYNSPTVNLLWPKLAVTAGDRTLVGAFFAIIGGPPNMLLYSIDPSGDLVRTDLYSSTSISNNPMFTGVEADGASEVILTGYTGMPQRALIARVDTSGALLGAQMVNADTVGQVERTLQLWSADAAGGMLHLSGDLSETDVMFGTGDRSPAAWRTTDGLASACFVEPLSLQRITVPAGVVIASPVGSVQALVASAQAGNTLNEPFTLPIASSFCTAVSVNEQRAKPEWSLSPNPVSDEFFLSGQGLSPGTQWTIMDAAGAIVKTGRLSGTTAGIPVQALVPGAYMLRIVNDHGTQAERFIKY